jgi:hypothetical protein
MTSICRRITKASLSTDSFISAALAPRTGDLGE